MTLKFWLLFFISFGIITVLFYRLSNFEDNWIDYNYNISPYDKRKRKIIIRWIVFFLWPIILPLMTIFVIVYVIWDFLKMIFCLFFDND